MVNPANLPTPPAASGRPQVTSGAAVASLVLGILSLLLSCFTGIPAIICGAIGLRSIAGSRRASTGPILTGKGMAVAGLVLGGVTTSLPVIGTLLMLLLPATQNMREAAQRTQCMTNLRQMGQAMLVAEDASKHLPAAIVDAKGRPLLSWRVALLPYLEERPLYSQFHLDEPWDSEHNKALIPKMPTIYACPSSPESLRDGRTTYLAAVGQGMALHQPAPLGAPMNGARIAGVKVATLADGMTKTILILEVAPEDAVPWTKPENFSCAPADAHGRLFRGGAHAGGIHAAVFADTHIEPIVADMEPKDLAARLTRAAGDVVEW